MLARGVSDAVTTISPSKTDSNSMQVLRVTIELGWISRFSQLQLTCLECHTVCRQVGRFRLKIARKTPKTVWHTKLSKTRKLGNRSERLTLPQVTKMLWERPTFDLHRDLALPEELRQLILGVEFGGALDGVEWPAALETLVFWRR